MGTKIDVPAAALRAAAIAAIRPTDERYHDVGQVVQIDSETCAVAGSNNEILSVTYVPGLRKENIRVLMDRHDVHAAWSVLKDNPGQKVTISENRKSVKIEAGAQSFKAEKIDATMRAMAAVVDGSRPGYVTLIDAKYIIALADHLKEVGAKETPLRNSGSEPYDGTIVEMRTFGKYEPVQFWFKDDAGFDNVFVIQYLSNPGGGWIGLPPEDDIGSVTTTIINDAHYQKLNAMNVDIVEKGGDDDAS